MSRRLACDASRVVMRHDPEGRVVEVGARTRTIPPALRRALAHRDQTCRFPGCRGQIREGHHVQHWARGGPTALSNLVSLCRRHHRAVHEEGYQVARTADDGFQFRRPNGDVIPDVPPPAAVPADPVAAVRVENEASDVRIDARTACARWTGERLDLGWAIDVLHPRAAPAGLLLPTPPRDVQAEASQTPSADDEDASLPAGFGQERTTGSTSFA